MTVVAPPTPAPGLPERYYAPDFVVEIGGVALDQESKGDVLELKVEMAMKEMTSVDLKLNNYDDRTFDLKWSDSPTSSGSAAGRTSSWATPSRCCR